MAAPASRPRRMWTLLRSRKVAVWLLFGCAVWVMLGTLFVAVDPEPKGIRALIESNPTLTAAARIVGLDRAFSNPLFLVVLAWLGLSTAACAVERTRWAVVAAKPPVGLSSDLEARLRRSPRVSVPCADERALDRVKDHLRASGMKVHATEHAVYAERFRWGVLGSPIFHWALTALFVVVALGQMTRFEGLIGVPVGESAPFAVDTFPVESRGVLYRTVYGDMTIGVSDLRFGYEAGGIDRGEVPEVVLARNGAEVARQLVYANAPLRYRSLLIHQSDFGVSPKVTLLANDGSVVDTSSLIVDFDRTSRQGFTAQEFALTGAGGAGEVTVRVTVVGSPRDIVSGRGTEKARLSAKATGRDGAVIASKVLSPGEALELPGGSLRYDGLGYYARLSVADDWSIYPIYVLFFLATAGIAVAVLAPKRTAWVLLDRGAGGSCELHAIFKHDRGDPVFEDMVVAALHAAAGMNDEGAA